MPSTTINNKTYTAYQVLFLLFLLKNIVLKFRLHQHKSEGKPEISNKAFQSKQSRIQRSQFSLVLPVLPPLYHDVPCQCGILTDHKSCIKSACPYFSVLCSTLLKFKENISVGKQYAQLLLSKSFTYLLNLKHRF